VVAGLLGEHDAVGLRLLQEDGASEFSSAVGYMMMMMCIDVLRCCVHGACGGKGL